MIIVRRTYNMFTYFYDKFQVSLIFNRFMIDNVENKLKKILKANKVGYCNKIQDLNTRI